MTAETIRAFLRKQPFSPFAIHMNDGRKLDVPHSDFVAIHPESATEAIVFLPRGRFEFVYLRNVSSIESEGAVPERTPRRPKDDQSE